MCDIEYGCSIPTRSPCVRSFVDQVLPDLIISSKDVSHQSADNSDAELMETGDEEVKVVDDDVHMKDNCSDESSNQKKKQDYLAKTGLIFLYFPIIF